MIKKEPGGGSHPGRKLKNEYGNMYFPYEGCSSGTQAGSRVDISLVIRGSKISSSFLDHSHTPSSMIVGQSYPSVHEHVNRQVVQPVSIPHVL